MNCLICYKSLQVGQMDYHSKCLSKTFEVKKLPEIEIETKDLKKYAAQIINAHKAITGVQPKLSMWLEKSKNTTRFTIRDDKSNFIIKPQSETYQHLPENEDLCMHMANEFGIEVAKHGLIRLKDGSLAYLTKRFDRLKETKIACEDLCQLSESLTEHKYRGSHEKVGKTIRQYSTLSGLDTVQYFKLIIFSFITGNADMHLKNFSMWEKDESTFCLSPAYDLISTALVIKDELEQMSLTINGKKNKLTKTDFENLGRSLQLNEKQILNTFNELRKKKDKFIEWINSSFLLNEQKGNLIDLLITRIDLFEQNESSIV